MNLFKNERQRSGFKRILKSALIILILLVLADLFTPSGTSAIEPLRYGRDVLPILAANCFSCHGPDEKNRKAGLRLDVEADAKANRRSGSPIAPGQPEKSVLLTRLTSTDPDVVMPPPSTHKQVTPAQIEIIRRWIAEGAQWGLHWSFEPVTRPVINISTQQPIETGTLSFVFE